jgi:fatty acid desaturase
VTRRWLERLVGLIVVAICTWPIILILALWPWLLPYVITALAVGVVGFYLGYGAHLHAAFEEREAEREAEGL